VNKDVQSRLKNITTIQKDFKRNSIELDRTVTSETTIHPSEDAGDKPDVKITANL